MTLPWSLLNGGNCKMIKYSWHMQIQIRARYHMHTPVRNSTCIFQNKRWFAITMRLNKWRTHIYNIQQTCNVPTIVVDCRVTHNYCSLMPRCITKYWSTRCYNVMTTIKTSHILPPFRARILRNINETKTIQRSWKIGSHFMALLSVIFCTYGTLITVWLLTIQFFAP